MVKSGSKYATIAEIAEKKINLLSAGADDKVALTQIKLELERIDEESKNNIAEIKLRPINIDLIKKQAKSYLEKKKAENRNNYDKKLFLEQEELQDLEREVEKKKKEIETLARFLFMEKEDLDDEAEQEYERVISSVGNKEETLKIEIKKEELRALERKAKLQAEHDRLNAKLKVQEEKEKCIQKVYDDLKEISLALGDNKR